MAILQTILSVFLLAGFIAAIETETGTFEMCKNSPRQLDLEQCTLTSSEENINKVSDNNPFIIGQCKLVFPDDVQVLTNAIHPKATYLGSEQVVSTRSLVILTNSDGDKITDEYVPGGGEMTMGFRIEYNGNFQFLEKGLVMIEIILKDQPKYDGWCLMAKTEIVETPVYYGRG